MFFDNRSLQKQANKQNKEGMATRKRKSRFCKMSTNWLQNNIKDVIWEVSVDVIRCNVKVIKINQSSTF